MFLIFFVDQSKEVFIILLFCILNEDSSCFTIGWNGAVVLIMQSTVLIGWVEQNCLNGWSLDCFNYWTWISREKTRNPNKPTTNTTLIQKQQLTRRTNSLSLLHSQYYTHTECAFIELRWWPVQGWININSKNTQLKEGGGEGEDERYRETEMRPVEYKELLFFYFMLH